MSKGYHPSAFRVVDEWGLPICTTLVCDALTHCCALEEHAGGIPEDALVLSKPSLFDNLRTVVETRILTR
jgi:hypothetical protein